MKLVGLISPNLSEDTLEDVYKVFPPGIRIEGRTLKVGKYTDDEFHRAELMFADLVRDLARSPLDFLMVTGELFLSYKGPGSDLEILDLVKKITPAPASTVLTAVVRGCQALELKRIVMASPFPEDQDERLVKFLAHYGIDVVAFRGLGCPNADVIWQLPPASGYDLAMALLREHSDVDGIYLPCNKWRTVFGHRAHRTGKQKAGGHQHAGVGLGSAAADEYARSDWRLWAASERAQINQRRGVVANPSSPPFNKGRN